MLMQLSVSCSNSTSDWENFNEQDIENEEEEDRKYGADDDGDMVLPAAMTRLHVLRAYP